MTTGFVMGKNKTVLTMKYVLFILLALILAACRSEKDRRLEYALEFAGDNRVELEKVLEHYRTDPEKLEAARFLIRNMSGWYSYEGNELDSIHHLLVGVCEGRSISKREKNKWNRISFDSLSKIYDAQVITAEYLIDNIDLAFEVWRKYPWNRNLPFDDFCELILPYRIADEPLSDWRKLYYEDYGTLLDSLYKGSDVIEASKIIDGKLRKEMIADAMDMTGITEVKNRLIKNLSKGYRQRVGFAQALLGYPEIIILDEPTVGLDPKQIIEIRELIKKLGENHTVILSSHILSEISAVCDHVFIISKGKLVASDATENLINLMSKNQEINLVLKSDEIGARGMLEKIVNVDKVTFEKSEEEKTVKAKVIAKANCDIREEIFELASAMHMPILEMHTVVKSLEDVFLELTGEGDEK